MYNTPVFDAINEYNKKGYSQFFMPGHKSGEGIPSLFKLDLTEIDETDNLHIPTGAIAEAQRLLAKAYGAKESFFLVNGSTCGIQAMLAATLSDGDKVLVCRTCHLSLISALTLCGAVPVFFDADFIPEAGVYGGVSPDVVKKVVAENPDAKAVYITSPDYSGFCSDISEICSIAHNSNMYLLVDEAHGAHFGFSKVLPKSAVAYGADMVVQSAHKTLPALTQSAYLHVNNEKLINKTKKALDMLLTLSPSYILMAYMDMARAVAEADGERIFEEIAKNCSEIFDLPFDFAVGYKRKYSVFDVDCTRICVFGDFSEFDFRKYKLVPEMADVCRVVFLPSAGTKAEDFARLREALENARIKKREFLMPPPLSEQIVSPRKAYFAENEQISIDECVGRICGRVVAPYPPGIPVLIPGQLITEDIKEYIKNCRTDVFGGNTEICVCKTGIF